MRTLQDVQRRDQELARKYEHELKLKDEEINIHKRTVDHKDQMLNDHRTMQGETQKSLMRELQTFKEKAETYESTI
jgi:hypothetical protein